MGPLRDCGALLGTAQRGVEEVAVADGPEGGLRGPLGKLGVEKGGWMREYLGNDTVGTPTHGTGEGGMNGRGPPALEGVRPLVGRGVMPGDESWGLGVTGGWNTPRLSGLFCQPKLEEAVGEGGF